ncbi:MAG: hypothetical protein ABIH23_28040, partial [bacterium]
VVTDESLNLLNYLKNILGASRDSVLCGAILMYRHFIETERERRLGVYEEVLRDLKQLHTELRQKGDHLRGIVLAPYDPVALRVEWLASDLEELLGEIQSAIKDGTPVKAL